LSAGNAGYLASLVSLSRSDGFDDEATSIPAAFFWEEGGSTGSRVVLVGAGGFLESRKPFTKKENPLSELDIQRGLDGLDVNRKTCCQKKLNAYPPFLSCFKSYYLRLISRTSKIANQLMQLLSFSQLLISNELRKTNVLEVVVCS